VPEHQHNSGWLDLLKSLPLYPLPHHLLSRAMLALTRIQTPWFKNLFIRKFSEHFKVDWDEARQQSPEAFEHFNAFFTRELAAGARPVAGDDTILISPADGCISQLGSIESEDIFQAKGRRFTTQDLLGGRLELAKQFSNGQFATIYLSPRDYHRVHMPCAGKLRETIYIPGRLFSVAPHTTRTIPRLFARNERLVAIFDTDHGSMAMVLVGAIFVAAIETVWAGLVTPPHRSDIEFRDYRSNNIQLARGAEMGRFNMGSTVILLFQKDRISWDKSLIPDQTLKMGQQISGTLDSTG
jgi:phosphatidylserine decarboxylase